MTLLERRRRLKSRKALARRPSLAHRKLSPFFHLRKANRPERSTSKQVPLDRMTSQAIEVEVGIMLEDDAPYSIQAIANALRGSSLVSDCFLGAEPPTAAPRRKGLSRLRFGFSQLPSPVKRRYELYGALDRIQARPGATELSISTWEQAKAELGHVFGFPEIEEDGAAGASALEKDPVERFRLEMEKITIAETARHGIGPSQRAWLELSKTLGAAADGADVAASKRLEEAYLERDKPSAAVQEVEARLEQKERDEEARKRASSLMRPLSAEEQELVNDALHGGGHEGETVAQSGPDSVSRGSIGTLRPACWLNDEVIHYFLLMLANRDEEMCKADPNRKRSHFFKSFFMTKLLNEGDLKSDGVYEYRNVKRWSKKVPGKDIFNLEKIIFPINQGNAHWVCAVAFMQEKRIQFYDSMGGSGRGYLESIFRYIQDEHKDKKGGPLPDADAWKLVPCTRDTPHQRNGFDCGVFTCMFADFLSKDCPLVFNQDHINQCRERIALSIMNGVAIM